MTLVEREPQANFEAITQSLARILKRQVPDVSPIAGKILDEVRREEILVQRPPSYSNSLTNFHLEPFVKDLSEMPKGVLQVDTSDIIEMQEFDARTVLAMSVADQYHDEKYDGQLNMVYRNAIGLQQCWLEQTGARIVLDPRSVPLDLILSKLMGPTMLAFDFGFSDWQDAVFAYSIGAGLEGEDLVTPDAHRGANSLDIGVANENIEDVLTHNQKTLAAVRNDRAVFLIARERLWRKYLKIDSTSVFELTPNPDSRTLELNRVRIGALNAVEMALAA